MQKKNIIYTCEVCGISRKGNCNSVTCKYCGTKMLLQSKDCKCYGTETIKRICCEGDELKINGIEIVKKYRLKTILNKNVFNKFQKMTTENELTYDGMLIKLINEYEGK